MKIASFNKRALAFIIDLIIIFAINGIFFRSFLFLPVGSLVTMFYAPIFLSSNIRATPGKYILKISVSRSNGSRLSLKDAYIRLFSSWLSSFLLGAGYFLSLFTENNKTLHDYISDTIVFDEVFENQGLFNEWLSQFKHLLKKFNIG